MVEIKMKEFLPAGFIPYVILGNAVLAELAKRFWGLKIPFCSPFTLSLSKQPVKLFEHADHTEKVVGVRAEDIHKWIDGLFDLEGFDNFLRHGKTAGFDPYGHRQYRHCQEALEDAFREFEGKYSKEQIRGVFETHLKDDYDGYIPVQSDFEDGTFREKYHETEDYAAADRILSKGELNDYFKNKFYANVRRKRQSKMRVGFWLGLLLPTVIAVGLFISAIFVLILPLFREDLLDQRRLMIRELTASAASAIEHHVGRVERGEIGLEAAQTQAVQEIRALRYGDENKDYFWITDMHPRMVMHPYRSDLIGTDLSHFMDAEDRSGKRLFVEFVDLVRSENEGYLEYLWQWKDDPMRKVPKLSYVRGIPEWGWIIGTGVYIHDVDQEIEGLTHRISIIFAFITAGLVLILLYILRQSLRIENERQQAEVGLTEAKDRYRALVEASNEGYVLELEGEHVYSNLTFQRLLGYSEEAVLSREIWSSIIPEIPINQVARQNLQHVFMGQTVRGEFEARVLKKSGESLDVIMRVSRIFFSEKNGHVISVRPIVRKMPTTMGGALPDKPGTASLLDFSAMRNEIRASASEGHVIRVLNGLPNLILQYIQAGEETANIRDIIAEAYNETVRRYLQLAEKELGKPPVPFAFLSLGSAARCEMTLFSDQDNAIVFAVEDPAATERIREYFLRLANRVCGKLNDAGFPFCLGGIMAANPKWCLSFEEWKQFVSEKIHHATDHSIQEVNIFLDFRAIYGAEDLAERLQGHIFQLAKTKTVFMKCYARNYLQYKLPLNPLGFLKAKDMDGTWQMNLKDCLNPIVVFARIYALKQEVRETGTLERLEALVSCGALKKEALGELSEAFRFFWRLRFDNQMKEHHDLRKVDDVIELGSITDSARHECQRMLSIVSTYKAKLSFDFLGIDPQLAE